MLSALHRPEAVIQRPAHGGEQMQQAMERSPYCVHIRVGHVDY